MKSIFQSFVAVLLIAVFTLLLFAAPPPSQATTTSSTTSIYGVPLSDTTTKVIAHVVSQSLASQASTMTKLQVSSETKDTRNEFASYKFTAKSPGLYCVGANASFTASDNGTREIIFYENGAATHIRECVPSRASAPAIGLSISGVLSLAATDYIELYGRQDSGGAITMDNSTEIFVIRFQ